MRTIHYARSCLHIAIHYTCKLHAKIQNDDDSLHVQTARSYKFGLARTKTKIPNSAEANAWT